MIELVRISPEYRRHLFEMMDEWTATGEKIVPFALRKVDYHDFEAFCAELDNMERGEVEGRVPSTTLFAIDTERDIFVGAVNIRHYLDDYMLNYAGHIGDGVRPSERRKGYATEMIRLALEECRKLGISRALMVCDKTNIGSAKSIINNGGVLENEIELDDGEIDQRYWIDI